MKEKNNHKNKDKIIFKMKELDKKNNIRKEFWDKISEEYRWKDRDKLNSRIDFIIKINRRENNNRLDNYKLTEKNNNLG